jgi:hypothetical protein
MLLKDSAPTTGSEASLNGPVESSPPPYSVAKLGQVGLFRAQRSRSLVVSSVVVQVFVFERHFRSRFGSL